MLGTFGNFQRFVWTPFTENYIESASSDGGFEISFEKIHKNHKKCTTSQIMLYQQALQLHKTINHVDFPQTFEQVTVVDQTICTSRQLWFQIFRNNKIKIGMNMTANKCYCLTGQISLQVLNSNKFT